MVMKEVLVLAILGLLIILLVGCTGPDQPTQVETPGQTLQQTRVQTPEGPAAPAPVSVVDANNQFALDLYSQLAQDTDSNIFFSPYSLSSALLSPGERRQRRSARCSTSRKTRHA
jgi:serine protease inhibitor